MQKHFYQERGARRDESGGGRVRACSALDLSELLIACQTSRREEEK